jgi:hypothetical protein
LTQSAAGRDMAAQFEAGGARHDSSKFILNFWEGKLQSNALTLEQKAKAK